MGNVSIKHQRKNIFEHSPPPSSRRFFDHRQVVKSSKCSPSIPSSPLPRKSKQSYSPIMPHRYVHKSAIKHYQERSHPQLHYHENSPYLKDSYSKQYQQTKHQPQKYFYDRKSQMSPRIIYGQKQKQRIDSSRKSSEYGSQYHQIERKEIMKKIRNFNQFINMVKKEIQDTKSNNSMKVRMELENKDFDVSKYQQILQKQFSRQGSQAKVKFQQDKECKVVNISFQQPKEEKGGIQLTESSTKCAKNSKEEIKERMKQAAQKLRQLSRKLYQDDLPKHNIVHNNILNIQNVLQNRGPMSQLGPQVANIQKCLKKMSELSKEQHHNNIKTIREFNLLQDSESLSFQHSRNF